MNKAKIIHMKALQKHLPKYLIVALINLLVFHIGYAENDSLAIPVDSVATENNTESVIDSIPEKGKIIVYTFNIKEEIDPPIWRKTKKAIEEAHRIKADLIFIVMNTYGGRVDIADSIRTKILQSKIPVYVLIENNAASAGALISIACDSIYMQPASTIGAATVVDQSGQQVPDKYQSYMRKKMRATAEETGRDPDIAEAMVDPDKVVPGISDSGKVLTFTTKEAIEHGFCEGQFNSIGEVLSAIGFNDYEVVKQKLSTIDAMIDFLTSTAISGILIMIIIGGIYFELQSPGVGFPILASITAAILYFAPLYLEGMAENWEIIIFIVGIGLLAVEIFAIPGFGVAGIFGIIMIVMGLTLSLVGNVGFDLSSFHGGAIVRALFVVVVASILSLTGSAFFGARFIKTKLFGRLMLQTVQNKEDGYIAVDASEFELIGREGIAATILRPSGKVEIDSDLYDATAETGYIEKGEKVRVVKYETAQLFVRKV